MDKKKLYFLGAVNNWILLIAGGTLLIIMFLQEKAYGDIIAIGMGFLGIIIGLLFSLGYVILYKTDTILNEIKKLKHGK